MSNSQYWSRYWRQRRSRRWVLGTAGAAGAGAAGLALVGCGDDDDGPAATATTAPPTNTTVPGETPVATPTEAETPTNGDGPTQGGTVRFPMVGLNSADPPTLYPFQNLTYLAQIPSVFHYSRLLQAPARPDISPTDFTVIEGDIAQGVPEQPDELTYTFTIKPNVHFHDKEPMNGRRATMEDFAATYQAFISESTNSGTFDAVVASVEAVDSETLSVTLTEPFAPFLITHASSNEGVWFIPVETISNGQVQTDPVGTGPWVFRQWETGVAMRWDANRNFHDAPVPWFDAIEASLLGDAQRVLSALEVGDLDLSGLAGSLFDEAVSRLDRSGTDLFTQTQVFGGFYFNFDNDGGRWHDRRLRQALSLAMDREGYLDTLDQTGQGDWHSSALSPALAPFFISPRDEATFGPNAKWFQYNPAEARQLLEAATGGDSINVRVTANVDAYGPAFQTLWELITSQIGDAGFNAELVYQDYGSYIASTYLGQIPDGIGLGPLIGSPRDPNDIFSRNMESTSARRNWAGTPIEEMPRLDELMATQRAIFDIDERVAFIQEMQREMAEAMLIVPYQGDAGYGYVQPWVQNYNNKGGYGYPRVSVAEAWFTPERIAGG
jgi:peptide/nickel transport system substrate-binding protein